MLNIHRLVQGAEIRSNLAAYSRSNTDGLGNLSRPEIGPKTTRRIAPAGVKTTAILPISNEHALSNLSLLTTAVLILVTSIFAGTFYIFASGQRYVGVTQFCGTGLLIAVIFCAALRLSGGHQPLKTSHIFGRARSAVVAWVTSFAFFLAIAFTFKFGTELSRGAAISFFLMGLVTVTSSHMHVPMLLARLLRSGAFMHRDIIVVGACGDPAIKRLIAGFQQGGCPGPHAVEFDAACSGMEWPYPRTALLNSIIALAPRLGPGESHLIATTIAMNKGARKAMATDDSKISLLRLRARLKPFIGTFCTSTAISSPAMLNGWRRSCAVNSSGTTKTARGTSVRARRMLSVRAWGICELAK